MDRRARADFALRQHRLNQGAMLRALYAKTASAYSIPTRDSANQLPGWLWVGDYFSLIPDALYPPDPAVLRAIREFCPDAQPITIRSVWRRSLADGTPDEMVLVRHGLARAIPDLLLPAHFFRCSTPELMKLGSETLQTPNYIEVNWYDREDRPFGYDMPGAYLPFDWEFYYALRRCYTDQLRPKELSRALVNPYIERKSRRESQQQAEDAYVRRDIERFYSREPSTPEWEAVLSGHAKPRSQPVSISVPKEVVL